MVTPLTYKHTGLRWIDVCAGDELVAVMEVGPVPGCYWVRFYFGDNYQLSTRYRRDSLEAAKEFCEERWRSHQQGVAS